MEREALNIMRESFGRDTLISLATIGDGIPHVRTVNAYYEDGSFYLVTHAMSNKVKQLSASPNAAICGDWFTAHGIGINLGWIRSENNIHIAKKLREAFASWYSNGHINEDDTSTCILKIKLTDGVLYNRGRRYDIDFTEEEPEEQTDFSKITPCGGCCEGCQFKLNKECVGCRESGGKCVKMWENGCAIYACAEKHGAYFCGICQNFPCTWLGQKLEEWDKDGISKLFRLKKEYEKQK